MRHLVALLAEEEHLTAFQGFFDSFRSVKPTIQRRTPFAKQAEAFRERMFDIEFFRQCCSYGERRAMAKAEFNFATRGPLNKLISHPFGDDAPRVWRLIFESNKDKRVCMKSQPDEVVEKVVANKRKTTEIDTSSNSAKRMNVSKSDPFFGPVEANAEPGECGMFNFGRSCFLNAVLQCLAHIDGMREAFVENFGTQQLNL